MLLGSLALAGAGAFALWSAPAADAARAPTKAERSALRSVGLKACRAWGDTGCKVTAIRVSTVNRRYAYVATASSSRYPRLIVKRPRATGGGWKVRTELGDRAVACADLVRFAAPRRVLRDLGIQGYTGSGGHYGTC